MCVRWGGGDSEGVKASALEEEYISLRKNSITLARTNFAFERLGAPQPGGFPF